MTTKYTGDPANVTTPLPQRTVTNATNATPIVITTSAAHGYGDNDTVEVAAVGGNTAANGFWKITWLSTTTFSLDGSVGSGAYTSGGTVNNYSLNPEMTEPSDGELRSVASVLNMTRANADRTQFLGLRSNPLANLTALAALKVPTNGMVRYVTGFGPYTFLTSATTGLSPFRVAATDATAGGWVAGAAYETSFTKRLGLANRINQFKLAATYSVDATYDPTTTTQLSYGSGTGSGVVTKLVDTGATNGYHYRFSINDCLVHGATLASALLRFSTGGAPRSVPAKQPGLAIVRRPLTGYLPAATKLLSSPASGFAIAAAADAAAYGALESLTFTADQNNSIDLATYMYEAIIMDESHTNALAGNEFKTLAITMSAIPDARRY